MRFARVIDIPQEQFKMKRKNILIIIGCILIVLLIGVVLSEEIINWGNSNKEPVEESVLDYIKSIEIYEVVYDNGVNHFYNKNDEIPLFTDYRIIKAFQELIEENEMLKEDLCSLGVERWC